MSLASRTSDLLERRIEGLSWSLADSDAVDFATPPGEPAVASADSLSWQVFRNPLSMFIGGIAAVLLELGEPRVRSGVWEHSSFRRDPVRRLRRTGMAAMVTVYAARSRFEALAARVRTLHGRIDGVTPEGDPYRADDPELLRWVHGTAAFGFLAAYRTYIRPVGQAERDLYYAEGVAGAALYGAVGAPSSEAAMATMLAEMRPQLEPSPILAELIAILRAAPILPAVLRPLQHLIIRAAVDLVPPCERSRLQLTSHGGMRTGETMLLRGLARGLGRIVLPSAPSSQACVRLGLPHDYLVTRPRA